MKIHICYITFSSHSETKLHNQNTESWFGLLWGNEVYVLPLKSFNAKTDINFYQFEILWIKPLKNKENNKEICQIFHNFKNIPCYVMSEVSLERFYFALFDNGLTFKTLKLAFICFCIQTLHLFSEQGLGPFSNMECAFQSKDYMFTIHRVFLWTRKN